MRSARVAAQAKINLRLRVLAREVSGFHSIETVFQRIDLADDIMVRAGGPVRSIDCRGAGVGPPERNLAFRAAELYAAQRGWPAGFQIEIEKRIPVGGGMGGGSADAGAVLRALDALAPDPAGERALVRMGASLGADVAVMTIDSPLALGWGRGDRLVGLDALPPVPVVALVPPYPIATADAYGWLAASREGLTAPGGWELVRDDLADWESIREIAGNDFDSVVFARHPDLGSAAGRLRSAGAWMSMLSGSGSAVVGVFPGGGGSTGRIDGPEGGAGRSGIPGDAIVGLAIPEGFRGLATMTAAAVSEVELLD